MKLLKLISVREFKLILIGQNIPLEQGIKEFFDCYSMSRFFIESFQLNTSQVLFCHVQWTCSGWKVERTNCKIASVPIEQWKCEIPFLLLMSLDFCSDWCNSRFSCKIWESSWQKCVLDSEIWSCRNCYARSDKDSKIKEFQSLLNEIRKFSSESKDKIRNQL